MDNTTAKTIVVTVVATIFSNLVAAEPPLTQLCVLLVFVAILELLKDDSALS